MPLHLPKFVPSDQYVAVKPLRIGRVIEAGETLPPDVPLRMLKRLYEQRRITFRMTNEATLPAEIDVQPPVPAEVATVEDEQQPVEVVAEDAPARSAKKKK